MLNATVHSSRAFTVCGKQSAAGLSLPPGQDNFVENDVMTNY